MAALVPASRTLSHTAGAKPIANALRFMFEAPVLLIGTSILMFGLDALVCSVARLAPLSLAIVVTANVLRIVIRAWLRPGYLRALDEARRGGEPSVDTVGSGLDRIGSTFVAHLVADVVAFLSVLVGALPGIGVVSFASSHDVPEIWTTAGIALAFVGSVLTYLYAWLGVRFAEHVIALEGRGPFAALGRAWRIASGRRIEIFSVIAFSAASELASLMWGIACLGIGAFWTVPVARMVGDHALLARFDECRVAHDRAAKERMAPAVSARWQPRFFAVRGVSLPEYALLLAAIIIVAGVAFRNLGRTAGTAANRAATALTAGGGASGAAASRASGASAVGSFFRDVGKGLIQGDFAGGPPSAGKVVGQVIGSVIPIYGQVAAARDIAAALVDVAHGKPGAGKEVVIAGLGALPGFGPELKAAAKAATVGEKLAAREAGAALAGAERAAAAAAKGELKALSAAERAELENFLRSSGVEEKYVQETIPGFAGGSKVITLEKDVTVYRYHGEGKDPRGRFVTDKPTSNPKDDLALPKDNPADQVTKYVIRKGTKVIEGRAAPRYDRPGGGNQFFVTDPKVLLDFK